MHQSEIGLMSSSCHGIEEAAGDITLMAVASISIKGGNSIANE